MMSKRKKAFFVFYISIIILMLIMYFYVQKYYKYEATHQRSENVGIINGIVISTKPVISAFYISHL